MQRVLPSIPFIIGLFVFSSFAITLFFMFNKGLLNWAESEAAGVRPALFATEIKILFVIKLSDLE